MDVYEVAAGRTSSQGDGSIGANRPPSMTRVGQALGEWQAGELRYMHRHPHCRGLSLAQLEDLYQETVLALLNRRFFNEEHLRNALRYGLSKRALHVHRDERRRSEILIEHAPEAHRTALRRSEIDGPEHAALAREDSRIVLEFISELTPLERKVYALEAEGMRYRAIAPVLGVEVNKARRTSRSVQSKRKRFQLLHDTGRLCGYRAPTIRALVAGQATSEQLAVAAFAHLEACAGCRAEHQTNAKRLRLSFQQRAAALLPVPALAGHLGWITRVDLRLRTLTHQWLPDFSTSGGGGVRERVIAAPREAASRRSSPLAPRPWRSSRAAR
jgi:RNA polymerase sigma factor (sigma-70 family)